MPNSPEIFFQPLSEATPFALALALRDAHNAIARLENPSDPSAALKQRKNDLANEVSKVLPDQGQKRAALGVLDIIFGGAVLSPVSPQT